MVHLFVVDGGQKIYFWLLIFSYQLYTYTSDHGYLKSCNKTDPITGLKFNIKEEEICDGVINCPEAEDEEFTRCDQLKALPASATVECESQWMDNVTIPAIKCNSQKECKSGEDEEDCVVPKWVLGVVFGLCLLLAMLSPYITLQCSKVKMKVDEDDLEIENSMDCYVQIIVVNSTNTSLRKKACWVLFQRKLGKNNGNKPTALNDLKVSS